jgi:DNA repair protein RadC
VGNCTDHTNQDHAPLAAPVEPPVTRPRSTRKPPERKLREALAAYRLDLPALRRLAAEAGDVRQALRRGEELPPEVTGLLDALVALLRPSPRERIKSPADVAALLMVEMAHLDQEELRVVALDSKNHVQAITTVYRGSVNSAIIRVGEIFKEAIRLNSASIIVVHSHPSGDPTPSPEDILVTRQIIDAGKLLDCELLDHLVIGDGRFVSLRERGLGFAK